MEKAIIFGSTDTGRRIYEDIKNNVEVVFLLTKTVSTGGLMWMVFLLNPQRI